MENPPPATPAAPETPAASATPASPADQPSATPSTPSTPAARPPPDKVRTNLKVAGMAMALLGALFVFQFGQGALFASQPDTWSGFPGGNLTVVIPDQAGVPVNLMYGGGANSSSHMTDAQGRVTVKLPEAYVTIHAQLQNQTFVRHAIVPSWQDVNVTVDAGQPVQQDRLEGFDISIFRIYWVHTTVSVIMLATGVLTFMMRAPTFSFIGATIGALGTALPLFQGAFTLPYIMACAACVFAAWTIRKNRDRFIPLRIGPLSL